LSSKKERLFDNALIFAISFFNIAFVILTLFADSSRIIYLFPLLLIWIAVPFYIGYLRGAIEIDTIVERIRGWVYLIVGVSSYFGFSARSIFGLSPDVSLVFYMLTPLIGFYLSLKLINWALPIFNKTLSGGKQIALVSTGCAAVFLSYTAFAFIMILESLATGAVELYILIPSLSVVLTLILTGFLIYEKISRVAVHCRGKFGFKSRILKFLFIAFYVGVVGLASSKKLFYSFMTGLLLVLFGSIVGPRYLEVTPLFFLPALVLLWAGLLHFASYRLPHKNVCAQFRALYVKGKLQ
jgi:hypothetical protein